MSHLRHLRGYAPARLAHAVAAFGGVYVFTRLMGADDYGRYALLVSLLALVHTASVTWSEAAAYRFAGRARMKGRLADHAALALRVLGMSSLGGLTLLALIWLVLRDIEGYGPVLPVLGALLIAGSVVQLAQETHRAEMRVARYSANEVAHVFGGFMFGAAMAWMGDFGAAAPLVGLLVARSLVALREGVWLVRTARGGRATQGEGRAWLVYGLPVAAALVLDLVLSASDRFLIAVFLDEAAVGAYAAGYGVADKTVLMLCAWPAIAASPMLMAQFETHGATAAAESARGMITTIMFIAVPAAFGLALVAAPLGQAMIGEAVRAEAIAIIPWIAFAGLFNGLMVYVASEPFQLTRRTGLRACLMAVPAGLNLVLNLLFLPWFGLMGAVYATVISYVLGFAVLAGAGRRLVSMAWPVGDLVKIIVSAAAMAPAVWSVPNMGGWTQLVLEAGAGGAIYLLCAIAFNVAGARVFVTTQIASKTRREA